MPLGSLQALELSRVDDKRIPLDTWGMKLRLRAGAGPTGDLELRDLELALASRAQLEALAACLSHAHLEATGKPLKQESRLR